jgi:hypothetical protein
MAYRAGVNIPEGMTIPEGAPADVYDESTFIYEKDGKQETFTLANLPDDTWTFVDAPAPKLLKKGYEPPTKDFSITSLETGESVHENVFAQGGYLLFLTSANIADANLKNSDVLNELYQYSVDNNINFMMLSGSSEQANQVYLQNARAKYPVYSTDATVLKSMVRSNPGIMLLKDNTILKKWNVNDAPSVDELKSLLSKNPADIIAESRSCSRLTTILFACVAFVLAVFFSAKAYGKKSND